MNQQAVFHHGRQRNLDHIPTAAIAAGEVVKGVWDGSSASWVWGVANTAIAAGERGAVDVFGIYKFKKESGGGVTFNAGDIVEWDFDNGTAVVSGITQLATCLEDASDGQDYVLARLLGTIVIDPNPMFGAVVHYNEEGVSESGGTLTEWANIGSGGSLWNLDNSLSFPAVTLQNGLQCPDFSAGDYVNPLASPTPLANWNGLWVIAFTTTAYTTAQIICERSTTSGWDLLWNGRPVPPDYEFVSGYSSPVPDQITAKTPIPANVLVCWYQYDGANQIAGIQNGIAIATSPLVVSDSFAKFTVGKATAGGLIGKACEIAVFNTTKSQTERQAITDYLYSKWAP